MDLLTIDPRDTVTYRDRKYPMPQGLAPYGRSATGAEVVAATIVARLGLSGHRVEDSRYIEEEAGSARWPRILDAQGSRAMRIECTADGRAVAWRYDRFAVSLNEAWAVTVDGRSLPVDLSSYFRAHETYARLAWIAHREIRGW
ncbi:hypothetical protein [Streptomyces candidus]|uniref:Uncharacterized protein n=1 Tax=Streptomyces candidus TaxID=67283 RepID=A0A7X0HMM0_9ACTN|nr:hypothetical protein [Streptomyces candidus]MBB6440238.1 hypothetical protein [Streptomyces candidus]GHH57742.1 hypothetical protein GCM10018773_65510 [Streptomyces candidus]